MIITIINIIIYHLQGEGTVSAVHAVYFAKDRIESSLGNIS